MELYLQGPLRGRIVAAFKVKRTSIKYNQRDGSSQVLGSPGCPFIWFFNQAILDDDEFERRDHI